ncbi:siroheme synthase CysG [Leeia sp. TBRC 13508]|uniref:Siroheme synthase n=1 Tax=Leeia speluncae TaxID=2884804 RepID=A0ABS8D4M0_9NEIS|nr:siroheme synthase CysG [Leeia speluncae]MCB6183166.1 siroheme synthase CysG [Leeia speluncae]
MEFFPIFMKLKQQPCLVVGGGEVALRKASLLEAAGAMVCIVSPELHPELQAKVDAGNMQHINGFFEPSQVEGKRIVIAATDDQTVNEAVYHAAEARSIPVNVVDQSELCRFIMPAIVDRSPLMIAVSTGGGVPVLARQMRTRLESLVPHGFGQLAKLASEFRVKAKSALPDVGTRRQFWEEALQGSIAEKVFAGKLEEARRDLEEQLSTPDIARYQRGAVYLVGGGPGNPDLLTFRALRLMQEADVVLYDNLVAPAIVELVRRDAERIYVGKKTNQHTLPQDDINQLLVKLAKEGKKVLRLKGGDPFIFGRGGEEIETLAENGIPFEVVPGITSAAGASCYAGIPLTHRDYAQACTFVTGHRREGEEALDWPRLVQKNETVVVYMGVGQSASICQQLILHGRDKDTPAAIVEQATTDNQRVITGTLTTLPELITEKGVKSPALIIIGDVVKLHDKLAWRG